jgi:hypothetical protein
MTKQENFQDICYCFGYTRRDIEQDFITNNRSLILEKILAEKKAGGCDCAAKALKVADAWLTSAG